MNQKKKANLKLRFTRIHRRIKVDVEKTGHTRRVSCIISVCFISRLGTVIEDGKKKKKTKRGQKE